MFGVARVKRSSYQFSVTKDRFDVLISEYEYKISLRRPTFYKKKQTHTQLFRRHKYKKKNYWI